MSFPLDTDICSAYIKGNPLVFGRFVQYGRRLAISTTTLGELFTWALRAKAPPRRLLDLNDILKLVAVLDVTPAAARQFGELRAAQFDAAAPGPEMDLFNAAVALVNNLTIVTHNTQDYADIPGLSFEDWTVP